MSVKTNMRLPKGTIIPNHIAVVMDGNGRWARSRGLSESKGHEAGGKAVREIIEAARKAGVHTITLWGFSTENWKRPPHEIKKIMSIIKKNIQIELETAHEEQVRFIHLGRKDRLPKDVLKWILKAEEETKNYKEHVLNLAIDYGGRDEIIRAVQHIVKDGISTHRIDENLIASYLDTAGQPYPYPDLFIRTSGEQRTSGLMPWQMTYSEFYFEPDHLPDMAPDNLKAAILDFSCRRRRFGAKEKGKQFKFKPHVVAGLELNWWRISKIPEGTTLSEYSIDHIKEQFGLSRELATEAAKYMFEAIVEGKRNKWGKSKASVFKFYRLIKEEIKLAFEPSVAATLQVKFWQEVDATDDIKKAANVEATARDLYSEVYRISRYQATKLAHLRVLANIEKNLAEQGRGEHHWEMAEDYLNKFYSALKERVA